MRHLAHTTALAALAWMIFHAPAALAQPSDSAGPWRPPASCFFDEDAPPPGQGFGRGRGRGRGMGRMGWAGRYELKNALYPIRLVRRNAAQIGLSPDQEERLRNLATQTHAQVEKLRWQLDKKNAELIALVRGNEKKPKISKQLDAVLKLENQIKKAHLTMLIDVRDVLSPEQRSQLDELRNRSTDWSWKWDGKRKRKRHRRK